MTGTDCVIQQAGAIAFKPGTPPLVLLVRGKKDPAHWIFPKGHVDPGETAEDAAIRELLEEAGIKGKCLQPAGWGTHRLMGKEYRVLYFVVEYISTIGEGEAGRAPGWYSINEAFKLLTFADSREILKNMIPYLAEFKS